MKKISDTTPHNIIAHDRATSIRTLETRCLHQHAKGDQQRNKDHMGDVTAADEGCPFPNTVHGTPSGGAAIAN
jgi:hypothetical protein